MGRVNEYMVIRYKYKIQSRRKKINLDFETECENMEGKA